MFLTIQWFFNARSLGFNFAASFLFTDSKVFCRNFKCLPKFTIGSYYREKSSEWKKRVGPGLLAYRLATPLACFAALLQNEMKYNDFARFTNYETNPSYNK